MKHIYHKDYNENIYYKRLKNGLKVYLIPKNNFHKTFVTFTAKYGSLDLSFVPLGKTRKVNQPAGIAHFLEHKLFAMPDNTDAFEKLSSYGVSANAFTSFDKTSYLFSGTDNIKEALIYLLDFVQTPYFTASSVKKEQGIILEELLMYQDYPSTRLFYEIFKNLYKNHPVKNEVIGTKESIFKITPHTLYQAYNTFYHPSNMILTVVGNFDQNEFIKLIENNQDSKNYKFYDPIIRSLPNEPFKIVNKKSEIEMSVNSPYLGLGVKLRPKQTSIEQVRDNFIYTLLLDMCFSKSGDNYQNLLKKGLVNNSYSYEVGEVNGAINILFNANAPKSEELEEELIKMLVNLKRKTINKEELERNKKSILGNFIRQFNSIEEINLNFMSNIMYDIDLFELPELIESITAEELKEAAKQIKKEYITTVTIVPKNS